MVPVLLLLVVVLRMTGEGKSDVLVARFVGIVARLVVVAVRRGVLVLRVRWGEVCSSFTAASSFAVTVTVWHLISVAVVVSIVVVEVAMTLASAGGV